MLKLNDHHHVAKLLVLLLIITTTRAQQSSTDDNNNYLSTTSFNPSVAILIIVLISAFFFLGFFSVYIRNCGAANSVGGNGNSIRGALANAMARSRRQRGLEPAVLDTFPTMIYSEVKEHKIGKGSLECAVCLSEFEDDENLRLLPKCDHVFHTDCIDAWLASHVTCPVCRCNLTPDPAQPSNETQAQEGDSSGATTDHQVLIIDVQDSSTTDQERNTIDQEAIELERIGSQRRAIRAKSVKRPTNFTRSHSTGHSIVATVDKDKYTLKLPENIRKEIIASGNLKRSKSLQFSFPTQGEASSRRGFRGGEGSSRGGRSVRLGQLGRSDRWPSFIVRNFSTRVPVRSGKIKPDAEGSNSSRV